MERPVTYQPYTWKKVASRLESMSPQQLHVLALKAGMGADDETHGALHYLLDHGGFLLSEFGLLHDPEATRRTVFMYDIHEYVIYDDAAIQLANGEDVTLRYVGGDFAAIFTSQELIAALKNSPEFDQLERKEKPLSQ